MPYVHQAIEQFRKQLASVIAGKCGRVEHCVQHDRTSLQSSTYYVISLRI